MSGLAVAGLTVAVTAVTVLLMAGVACYLLRLRNRAHRQRAGRPIECTDREQNAQLVLLRPTH